MPDPDVDREGEVLTERETKLEKPKLFKVLLHNDDFTTMDFVVFVLQYVFKNRAKAVGANWKIEYRTPGPMREVPIPFELKNIPLP